MNKTVKISIITLLISLLLIGCSKEDNINTNIGGSNTTETKIETTDKDNETQPEEIGNIDSVYQSIPEENNSYLRFFVDNWNNEEITYSPAKYKFQEGLTDNSELLDLLDKAMYNTLIHNVYFRVDIGQDKYNVVLTNDLGEQFRQELDNNLEPTTISVILNNFNFYEYSFDTETISYDKNIGELGYLTYPIISAIDGNGTVQYHYGSDIYNDPVLSIVIDFNGYDEITEMHKYIPDELRESIIGYLQESTGVKIEDEETLNLRFEYTVNSHGFMSMGYYLYYGEPLGVEEDDWKNCYAVWLISTYWTVYDWELSSDWYEITNGVDTTSGTRLFNNFLQDNQIVTEMLNTFFNNEYESLVDTEEENEENKQEIIEAKENSVDLDE